MKFSCKTTPICFLSIAGFTSDISIPSTDILPASGTRARHQLVQELTREKQRLLNTVFISFSGLTQEKIFSNKFGATSTALIEEFSSLDELAYMSTDELVDYIRKKGKNHFDDPEEIAEAVQRAAKNSYRPPQVIADAAKQMLAISMNTIRLLQKQIKEYDKAIEKMLEAFLQTLTSIKGIGNIYAAGIIAEIGDINRFPSQSGRPCEICRSCLDSAPVQ